MPAATIIILMLGLDVCIETNYARGHLDGDEGGRASCAAMFLGSLCFLKCACMCVPAACRLHFDSLESLPDLEKLPSEEFAPLGSR